MISMPTKKTEIQIETHEVWGIRQQPDSASVVCGDCQAGGLMIPVEKAAVVCQCSRRLIYRWIEKGALHFRELPDGAVLVCGVTLAAKLEQLEDATGALAR